MDAQELLAQARETFGVRREYGEPYEHDGVTVIPVSTVRGGGGGGSGHDERGTGGGGGFGLTARPAGAWVIRGEHVTWKPVIDPMRILLGAEVLAILALLRSARPRGRHPRHIRLRTHGHRRLPHR
jgi:uncharacterized spore protein YtfJ